MTPIERAIESTKNRIHYLNESSKDGTPSHCNKAEKQEEIQKVILDALEKQIPKKPIVSRWNGICGIPYQRCPECEVLLYGSKIDNKYNHCHNCGQAIDWSVEISKETD